MSLVKTSGIRHGIALIEAAVALAVMSIGILALVGVQSTLRANSDLSRQRVDATRIAVQDLESQRFFATLNSVAGQANPSWDEIASGTVDSYDLPDSTNNATYKIVRTVANSAANQTRFKTVDVTVNWSDRGGADNSVSLGTVITAVDPVVASLLTVPPNWPAFARRSGRALSIPVDATPFDDGTSGFKPPAGGGVAWRFDNTSGYITQLCTGVTATQANLAKSDLSNCTTVNGRLVSGTVQFDLRTGTVDRDVAALPTGPAMPLDSATPLQFGVLANSVVPTVNAVDGTTDSPNPQCFANSPASVAAAAGLTSINYFCVVKVGDETTPGWGGKIDLKPAATYASGETGWSEGTDANHFKICRYTRYKTTAIQFAPNNEHPQTYCRVTNLACSNRVTENLTNQNFLVIRGTAACPADDRTVSAAAGVLVNYNTVQHQPLP